MARRRAVKTIEAKLLVDLTQFSKGFDKAAKTLERRGSQLVSAGTRISAAITAPLLAAGGVAVKFAADAEVSQRRFQKVFGESAKEVKSFAATLGRATGNSSFALQALLANTQDIITGLGATTEEGAELSKQLTVLGTDLAAFTGTDAEESILALTRALTGETEGLKSLGLAIKAADIDMKLLEQGIEGGAKAATNAERAVAILAVAQDQSANAAGAAARNSDTLNAMWDATKSRAVDIATEIGEKLLPAVKDLLDVVGATLEVFGDLDEKQQDNVIQFGVTAAAIGPVVIGLGAIAKAGAFIASGFSTVVAGVTTAGTAVGAFLSGPLVATVGVLSTIAAGALGVAIAIKSAFDPRVAETFLDALGRFFGSVVDSLTDLSLFVVDLFTGQITSIDALKNRIASIEFPALDTSGFTQDVPKAFGGAFAEEFNTQKDIILGNLEEEVSKAKAFGGLIKDTLGLGAVEEGLDTIGRKIDENKAKADRLRLETARANAFLFGGKAPSFEQLGQVPGLQVPNLGVTAPSLPDGAPDSKLPEKIGETGTAAQEAEGFVANLQERFKRYTDAAQIGSDLVTNSIVKTSDAITDAIFAGESLADSFKAAAASILKEITRMTIQMTIFNAVSGALGGGSSFVSGFIGGGSTGKMSGGPIPAGGFARVGEAGPELISGPANVTPSSKLNQLARQQQPVLVQVINNSSNSATRQEETTGANGQRVIRTIVEDVIARDIGRNGNISRALTSNLTTRRRAS